VIGGDQRQKMERLLNREEGQDVEKINQEEIDRETTDVLIEMAISITGDEGEITT
jgi:hypothetical protein